MKMAQPQKSPTSCSPPNIIYRQLDAAIAPESGSKTRFNISFSSETPCRSWGDDEVLLHTAEAVKLDRLRSTGVLLYAHGSDANYGRIPIGALENIQLDEALRRCTATIAFDEDDEKAMAICRKVEKGLIKGISVRANPLTWTILRKGETSLDGKFSGPLAVATQWEPVEVSVEPIPADTSVGIGRSLQNSQTNNEEDFTMPDVILPANPMPPVQREITTPAADAAAVLGAAVLITAPAADAAAAISAERTRAMEIMQRCERHSINPTGFIERGLTVDQTNAEILRTLEAKNPPVTTSVVVVAAEEDKFRAAAADGMLLRSGVSIATPAEGSRDFRGMRLRDLAVECVQRSGVAAPQRMNDDKLFRSVITPDSAFSSILTDSVNKSMGIAYQAADTTYQLWTGKDSNPDFKPKQIFNISEAGELEEVPQGGELKSDVVTDSKITSVLTTFGKTFGFTRQSLINDDLGVISTIPAAYVRAAKRGINRAVYNLLKSNPTMTDGVRLFAAGHSNLGTPAAPGIVSYNEALGGMMHQKNLRGMEVLNIPPKFVLCDPLQYARHAVILRSTADPEGSNSGRFNPFGGMMQLIMDAELTEGAGALPYYFAADPNNCGTIVVSYLNGVEEPTLESQVGFEYLGIKWRIIHDRGITLMDYRGLYRNEGKVGI